MQALRAEVEVESIVGSVGTGYVGFTASAGNGFQYHDILSWTAPSTVTSQLFVEEVTSTLLADVECLPGRTLCTPSEAWIESRGAGRWHLILPAHWTAALSIPNPEKKAVVIDQERGSICWSVDAAPGSICNGPEGNSTGRGKLVLTQVEGNIRISLDVNPDRAKNEGYFEFEVRLGN
ncbi:hypothetical protein [Bryobacter aggregatus]|uniref:hypothetical protein n=1 Tax=Bryobacter aggregatus TaxID=360054 RepID=UPI0004E2788D|nr:hypothetical protein [Bryobacter aggregatus]